MPGAFSALGRGGEGSMGICMFPCGAHSTLNFGLLLRRFEPGFWPSVGYFPSMAGGSALQAKVEALYREHGEGQADGNLNWLLEKLQVSLLPPSDLGEMVDVRSDATLEEAIRLLSTKGILSAPVSDVDAPDDASWMDRFIGMVDFPGIVLWVLNHGSVQALQSPGKGPPTAADSSEDLADVDMKEADVTGAKRKADPDSLFEAQEDLFSLLQSSDELRSVKVADIAGSFRWAPFMPLTGEDTLLTLLLMVSTYRARAVPIVTLGQGPLSNLITQTSVTRFLASLATLPESASWAERPLSSFGLPAVSKEQLIKVEDTDPVLDPFRLMHRRGIGGVPVVEHGTEKVLGSIGVRDIQVLLLHPQVLRKHRTFTVAQFMALARQSSPPSPGTAVEKAPLTVSPSMPLRGFLQHLDSAHMPRAYATDEGGNLAGVVTLRDVIGKLVSEPKGYFGDFFRGVVPAVHNYSS